MYSKCIVHIVISIYIIFMPKLICILCVAHSTSEGQLTPVLPRLANKQNTVIILIFF